MTDSSTDPKPAKRRPGNPNLKKGQMPSHLTRDQLFQPGNQLAKKKPGAPKKQMFTTILRKAVEASCNFENPLTKQQGTMTVLEYVVLKLIYRACSGNLKAIEMMAERLEGKVVNTLNIDANVTAQSSVTHDVSVLGTDKLLQLRELISQTQINQEPEVEDDMSDLDNALVFDAIIVDEKNNYEKG